MVSGDSSVRLSSSRLPLQESVCWVLMPFYLASFKTLGVLNTPHIHTYAYTCICVVYILVSHTSTSTEFWAKWASEKSTPLPRSACSMGNTEARTTDRERSKAPWLPGLSLCLLCWTHPFSKECIPTPLLELVKLLTAWTTSCPVWIHFRKCQNEDCCWEWEQKQLETS